EPSPVEDIIDPDLLVCRPSQFDREIWIKKRVKGYKDVDYDRYDDDDEKLEKKATVELDKEITEHVKLRSTYQWMPAIFQIDQNSHVTITTPIPQLEKTSENEQLYRDIAQVFEAMLPAFRKAEIVGSEATAGNSLQVIVKAQSYNLKSDPQ
ncbi:unnamed protein product, partial [Rotaria sp. Silwood1]